MRTFNFKAKNIGDDKYLSYTMDENCELDEDVLDYCEDNNLKELIEIIYEEDDDYDYLTYNITDKVSLEDFIKNEMNATMVLNVLRNIANNLISLKEQAIQLSYILMNRGFIYVNEDYSVQFMCVPVEVKGSVVAEFKGFMRQLLANMKYDVVEDLSYVGKLLTYINGDNFNLRGLVGLSEALMEETGINFNEAAPIEADGVEVISGNSNVENMVDIMGTFNNDEPLPEIGDDDEYEEEEEEIDVPESMKSMIEEETQSEEADVEETTAETEQVVKETQVEEEQIEEDETAEEEQVELEMHIEKVLPQVEESVEEIQPVEEKAEEVLPDVAINSDDVASANKESQQSGSEFTLKGQKETDIDVIKNRIKQLVGEVPEAKTQGDADKNIKTIADLDRILESKPPIIKKNVVKVNRAALIQNLAAENENQEVEAGADDQTENIKVPVIEDVYDGAEENQTATEKPQADSAPEASQEIVQPANNGPKAVPYLIRVNTEERIMLDRFVFKIGKATRGVNYRVGGNGAISRQHAIIIQNDNGCFIKDNKSTNHTYVNGKIVEDGVEEKLINDCTITLGDEDFIFKIN